MLPLPPLIPTLAQERGGPWEIILWSGVLIGLVILAWIVIAFVKNRSQAWRGEGHAPPFSLHELRRMHREGHLSDEEFERARERVLAMTALEAGPAEKKDGEELNPDAVRDENPIAKEPDRPEESPESPLSPEDPAEPDSDRRDDPPR